MPVAASPSRISQTTTLAGGAPRAGQAGEAVANAAMFCSSPSAVFGLAVRPQAPST